MSNFPMPPHPPPTIQQVTGVLQAAETILPLFLLPPHHHKNFGGPSPKSNTAPPPTSTQDSELASIKETLAALSKAVEKLCSSKAPPPTLHAAPQKKDKAALPIQTYVDKAAAPPRPSLGLPSIICDWLNEHLTSSEHQQVRISATRWTDKGNLVLTGGISNTSHQLLTASLHIQSLLSEFYKGFIPPHTSLPIQANVKWSKILINRVPTGVTEGWAQKPQRSATQHCYSRTPPTPPSKSHRNPAGLASSLIVAFKDPDGSKSRALLASQQLHIFGVRAKVKHWKKTPPKPAQNPESAILNPQHAVSRSKKSSGQMSKVP
ncbi:hypothetical protein BJV78DRAFT_1287043 [Lactifluus subvellereus]|nr:hypothetical protein BJV78DRAFT_1287043 [Lactifluus subvellereus]